MRSAFAAWAMFLATTIVTAAVPAQVGAQYCRTAPDTSTEVIHLVQAVVTSTDTLDAALRDSLGIQAATDSEVVLVADEAKCQAAVDSLNANAARYGGTGTWSSLYLIWTGHQYAAYDPDPVEAAAFITFLDEKFRFLRVMVTP